MKLVGEQLEKWALSRKISNEKDLFGRSAFNRYYYSAYLVTREMLGEFKDDWKFCSHKSIPDLLEGEVKSKVKREIKKSLKSGLIKIGEYSRIHTNITKATNDLANLLRQAYDIRCVADYEPEKEITMNKKIIYLEHYKLSSAPGWTHQAHTYCNVIKKIWKELGFV